jgi:hypothetical protein
VRSVRTPGASIIDPPPKGLRGSFKVTSSLLHWCDGRHTQLSTASGRWGHIYEDRSGPVNLRWFWSLHGVVSKPLAMRTDGRAPTLDEAKAQFEAALAAIVRIVCWDKRPRRSGAV